MRRIKAIFFFMMPLILASCIKPYQPDINSLETDKFVVSGQVTSEEGYQTVTVSRTSPLNNPHPTPVAGCTVFIQDDAGNSYILEENEPGTYRAWFNASGLIVGRSYKTRIITPDGEELESAYDKMPPGPPIGPVYYLRKDIPTADPGNPNEGIQFYTDLDALGVSNPYYRWEAVETWEYHTVYPIEWWYDGTVHHTYPPDTSRLVCWKTLTVSQIFTLSTAGFSQNQYSMFPLHFVNNLTPRLAYGYSLLVNLFSISRAAFDYWDQMRINSSQQGGLYTQQPIAIKGNLVNRTDPGKEVLGFFGASSSSHTRIFVKDVENLVLKYDTMCSPPYMPRFGWRGVDPQEYPVYFLPPLLVLDNVCVDCLFQGGINVKPDFWPY